MHEIKIFSVKTSMSNDPDPDHALRNLQDSVNSWMRQVGDRIKSPNIHVIQNINNMAIFTTIVVNFEHTADT